MYAAKDFQSSDVIFSDQPLLSGFWRRFEFSETFDEITETIRKFNNRQWKALFGIIQRYSPDFDTMTVSKFKKEVRKLSVTTVTFLTDAIIHFAFPYTTTAPRPTLCSLGEKVSLLNHSCDPNAEVQKAMVT